MTDQLVSVAQLPPVRVMPARRTRRRHLRRPGSAARLTMFHALVVALVLGAVVVGLLRSFTSSYEHLAQQRLTAELRGFQQAAVQRTRGESLFQFTRHYLSSHPLPAGDVLVVHALGEGVVGGEGAQQLLENGYLRSVLRRPATRLVVRNLLVDGNPTEVLISPVRSGSRTVGTLIATTDLSAFVEERSRLLDGALLGAGVALLLTMLSAYLLLRRLLGTVGRLTAAAAEITAGDLHRRIGEYGSEDEVGRLARSFDYMLDHLDTAVSAQRRLLSDVSHQLRTPLTVIRGHLEVLERTQLRDDPASREAVDVVIDEVDHMRQLVDRMLLLGHAMEPDHFARDPVDLRAFVSDLFESARVMDHRQWRLGSIPDLVIAADAAKLRGAVLNLVDNALKATRTGDSIELSAELSGDAKWVLLHVDDSGPGIPVEQRAAALSRFGRPGARDAGGSGLGLAIVKAVAEAHGGGVRVGDSPLGGARVTIRLPADMPDGG